MKFLFCRSDCGPDAAVCLRTKDGKVKEIATAGTQQITCESACCNEGRVCYSPLTPLLLKKWFGNFRLKAWVKCQSGCRSVCLCMDAVFMCFTKHYILVDCVTMT